MSTGTKKKGKTNSPKTRITRWDFADQADENGVYTLRFRAVRFMLDSGNYETIITNLPRDNEFTSDEIKNLYHLRWGIETSFRELKYAVGMINCHSIRENSIFQDIYASLIMYNYANRISREVVLATREPRKYVYCVNHKMAVFLCREHFRTPNADGEKLMRDIARYTEAVREGRQDERKLVAKSFAGFTYRVAA